MTITKVAVAGGTGNLGSAVVSALVKAGFQVTVLSRSASDQLDANVKVAIVDYNSLSSIISAISGKEALVNMLQVGIVPREIHLRLVEAAHVAGVARFIPSEFGCDTSHPLTSQLPVFGDKIAVIQKLKEIAEKEDKFAYTAILTGPALDWCLQHGIFVNFSGPTTPIYDGGDVPFSTTTLKGIGHAVSEVLQHPDETRNRHVYVSEAVVTQNQLLSYIDKDKSLQTEAIQTEDLEREAYEAIKQHHDLPASYAKLIRRAIFGGKFGALFATVDNDMLGITKLSEIEIADLVRQCL